MKVNVVMRPRIDGGQNHQNSTKIEILTFCKLIDCWWS